MEGVTTMYNKVNLMSMRLQFFAADDSAAGGQQSAEKGNGDQNEIDLDIDNLTDTQVKVLKEKLGFKDNDDIDSIVRNKKLKWQKEQEAKEAEAKKLEDMNDLEKADHEKQKLLDRIAEFERQDNLQKMATEASKMLKEADLPVDPELIGLIVAEEAETTQKVMKSVIAYVNDVIEKEHIKKNTGSTPEVLGKGSKKQTSVSTTEQLNKNRIV